MTDDTTYGRSAEKEREIGKRAMQSARGDALGMREDSTSVEEVVDTSMKNVRKGDWVTYRTSEGWVSQQQKVLEVRPDDVLIVGSHDGDPDPTPVERDDVIEVM